MGNIIQIIPGEGWKAVYAESKDEPRYFRKPLVCFGLVEVMAEMPDHSQVLMREVLGFTTCEGDISSVSVDVPNFLGYEAPGEEADEAFDEAWEYYADAKAPVIV